MHVRLSLSGSASFSSPLFASNTMLGKRRALDDAEQDDGCPDPKRSKGCVTLGKERDAAANKENIPLFARGPSRSTLRRCAWTGSDPGAPAPHRLRRTVSLAPHSLPSQSAARDSWSSSLSHKLALSL
ncbi:hypothetical protein AURDEDRAFT_117512 [Auricularia subglabra TFB-10046 SS5]|nr:hypothetical protein AURDEDRAFT_117512 [Auricularia subglabra TFB-10046 SS5]